MRIMVFAIPALIALSACSDDAGTGAEAADGGANEADVAAPSAAGDATLDDALACWGLTNRAYFLHQAITGGGGNLPNPPTQIYRAWHNVAATAAHGDGMTLSAFEARQQDAQRKTTVYSLDVEPDHAAAVQRCIDTAPPLGPDPELNWPQD